MAHFSGVSGEETADISVYPTPLRNKQRRSSNTAKAFGMDTPLEVNSNDCCVGKILITRVNDPGKFLCFSLWQKNRQLKCRGTMPVATRSCSKQKRRPRIEDETPATTKTNRSCRYVTRSTTKRKILQQNNVVKDLEPLPKVGKARW